MHPLDDPQTRAGFFAWLDRYATSEEQPDMYFAVRHLLRDQPDLMESRSWPEILRIALS